MDQREVGIVASCAAVISASQLIINNNERKMKTRRRRVWVKDWLKARHEKGAYNAILNELKLNDFESVRRFNSFLIDPCIFHPSLQQIFLKIVRHGYSHTELRISRSQQSIVSEKTRFQSRGQWISSQILPNPLT